MIYYSLLVGCLMGIHTLFSSELPKPLSLYHPPPLQTCCTAFIQKMIAEDEGQDTFKYEKLLQSLYDHPNLYTVLNELDKNSISQPSWHEEFHIEGTVQTAAINSLGIAWGDPQEEGAIEYTPWNRSPGFHLSTPIQRDIRYIALSQESTHFAAASARECCIYDMPHNIFCQHIKTPVEIYSLAFSPQNELFVGHNHRLTIIRNDRSIVDFFFDPSLIPFKITALTVPSSTQLIATNHQNMALFAKSTDNFQSMHYTFHKTEQPSIAPLTTSILYSCDKSIFAYLLGRTLYYNELDKQATDIKNVPELSLEQLLGITPAFTILAISEDKKLWALTYNKKTQQITDQNCFLLPQSPHPSLGRSLSPYTLSTSVPCPCLPLLLHNVYQEQPETLVMLPSSTPRLLCVKLAAYKAYKRNDVQKLKELELLCQQEGLDPLVLKYIQYGIHRERSARQKETISASFKRRLSLP